MWRKVDRKLPLKTDDCCGRSRQLSFRDTSHDRLPVLQQLALNCPSTLTALNGLREFFKIEYMNLGGESGQEEYV